MKNKIESDYIIEFRNEYEILTDELNLNSKGIHIIADLLDAAEEREYNRGLVDVILYTIHEHYSDFYKALNLPTWQQKYIESITLDKDNNPSSTYEYSDDYFE